MARCRDAVMLSAIGRLCCPLSSSVVIGTASAASTPSGGGSLPSGVKADVLHDSMGVAAGQHVFVISIDGDLSVFDPEIALVLF
jgi:hypothetical protein